MELEVLLHVPFKQDPLGHILVGHIVDVKAVAERRQPVEAVAPFSIGHTPPRSGALTRQQLFEFPLCRPAIPFELRAQTNVDALHGLTVGVSDSACHRMELRFVGYSDRFGCSWAGDELSSEEQCEHGLYVS